MSTLANSATNNSIGDPSALMDPFSVRIAYTCPYTVLIPDPVNVSGICLLKNSNPLRNYSYASEYRPSGPALHPDVSGSILLGREGYWDEVLETAELVANGSTNLLFYSGYRYADRVQEKTMVRYDIGVASRASASDGPYSRLNNGSPVIRRSANWYDNNAAASPTVVFVNGIYHMIYTGHCYTSPSNTCPGGASGGTGTRLIYARSFVQNPTSFTKMNIISFTNGPFWWNPEVAEADLVFANDGFYYLFVTGFANDISYLGIARAATPGGPYTYLSSQPILSPGTVGTFDHHGVLAPTIVANGATTHLWYMTTNFWMDSLVRLNYQATIGYSKATY